MRNFDIATHPNDGYGFLRAGPSQSSTQVTDQPEPLMKPTERFRYTRVVVCISNNPKQFAHNTRSSFKSHARFTVGVVAGLSLIPLLPTLLASRVTRPIPPPPPLPGSHSVTFN